MAGEDDLAACVILLVEALDAGPIAAYEPFSLAPDENAVDAYRRALELGSPLLARALVSAAAGTLATVPQIGEATYAAKLGRDDLALDPQGPVAVQHARVRALAAASGARLGSRTAPSRSGARAPRPAARSSRAGSPSTRGGCCSAAPTVRSSSSSVQPAGKRRMQATAWARGLRSELPAAART